MKKWQFAFSKENPKEAYYPGDTVAGRLLLDLDQPKHYTKISIQFNGRSYVHWTESRNKSTVAFTSTDQYIDKEVTLWEDEQSNETQLNQDQHSWPFSFTIPENAPSYLEGDYGNIRYSLLGKASGKKSTATVAEVQIAVLQLVKISDPRLLQPVRQEIQRRVCCLCCASGPIVLTVALPKAGFCLGESIQLHAALENGSNRRLTMSARLKQHILYHAGGSTRMSKKILFTTTSGGIGRRETQDWNPTIEIPTANINIIHNSSCNNIKVAHSVQVDCHIPYSPRISVIIPLQLGNCST